MESLPNHQEGNQVEKEETLVSHLVELRSRLLWAVVSVLIVFIALCIYPGTKEIYDFLARPMASVLPTGDKMIAYGVVTPFLVPLKVTLLSALVLALPLVLYQAWAFIAPGLYKHEKRLIFPLVVSSYLLFLIGMAFCYFFVFHTVFHFIATVSPDSINFAPDIEAYVDFVMTMFIAFGFTFEVPVIVIVLVSTGIVDIVKLKNARPYVIVGAFVVAAVLTPPDVISQFMMAVPLILLYELGIMAARVLRTRVSSEEEN
ncbi:twin-arginine translocase subunit TatC [Pelistega sp. NLN82]|uniref:Sec-independent protein translocase protein TatC n=1 Tax=Pelistega ratti TaxID=2652177 RepID=A0A6L9Y7H6_9BURK|nr:twin-arginine translocase subunit TatC [Pelistega ratti]NEN76460.1 twin-arginine translocase subunit TatC [Pelistega ratti]